MAIDYEAIRQALRPRVKVLRSVDAPTATAHDVRLWLDRAPGGTGTFRALDGTTALPPRIPACGCTDGITWHTVLNLARGPGAPCICLAPRRARQRLARHERLIPDIRRIDGQRTVALRSCRWCGGAGFIPGWPYPSNKDYPPGDTAPAQLSAEACDHHVVWLSDATLLRGASANPVTGRRYPQPRDLVVERRAITPDTGNPDGRGRLLDP